MKIQESLEQLASYNLQQRSVANRLDVTTEKLKRFHAILDTFAGDESDQKNNPCLAALTLLRSPMQPSTYGRMRQALSAQPLQQQSIPADINMRPEGFKGPASVETINAASTEPTLSPQGQSNDKVRIDRYVKHAAVKYSLPENLIKGVIRAESNFNPRALSRAGAQGLMQLMPATARELGVTDALRHRAKYRRRFSISQADDRPL